MTEGTTNNPVSSLDLVDDGIATAALITDETGLTGVDSIILDEAVIDAIVNLDPFDAIMMDETIPTGTDAIGNPASVNVNVNPAAVAAVETHVAILAPNFTDAIPVIAKVGGQKANVAIAAPNVVIVAPNITDATPVVAKLGGPKLNVAIATPSITRHRFNPRGLAKVGGPKVDTAASLGFVPRIQGAMCWSRIKSKATDAFSILDNNDQQQIINLLDEDENDLKHLTRQVDVVNAAGEVIHMSSEEDYWKKQIPKANQNMTVAQLIDT
jgi:hypothetical protein